LTLAPNGLDALERLGLRGQVLAAGRRLDAFEVRADGARCARFELAAVRAHTRFAVGILPSRLRDILEASVRDSVQLYRGHVVVSVARHRDGQHELTTRGPDGSVHVTRADVIVGADGVQSVVRGFVTTERAVHELDEGFAIMLGRGLATVDSSRQYLDADGLVGVVPVANDRTFIFVQYRRAALARLRSASFEQFKADVARRVPLVAPLLRDISDWSAVALAPTSVTHVRRWASGGVVLIGDAVHATTPSLAQGANSAIVDAVTLAGTVAAWCEAGQAARPDTYLSQFVSDRRRQATRQYWLGRALVRSSRHTTWPGQVAKLAVLRALAGNRRSHRLVIETLTGVLR
jgi:2-polyprenyl-6-methoxyphenol hydroxylase-like FAD-dependent oxidoreductase